METTKTPSAGAIRAAEAIWYDNDVNDAATNSDDLPRFVSLVAAIIDRETGASDMLGALRRIAAEDIGPDDSPADEAAYFDALHRAKKEAARAILAKATGEGGAE
jgi:hypothetical protein